ncbi:MAG: four helix bundle protein [Bacteroidales bacterium]|nr:four helix bundle protein [Bacteroidales bacterium]
MKEDLLKELSYKFALNTFKLCRKLQIEDREYIISRQLSKSGTSIGANIEEASGAQSTNDFIAKFHIALKEAKESNYWLRLLKDTQLITINEFEELMKDSNYIINLLTKSLKTAKDNKLNKE